MDLGHLNSWIGREQRIREILNPFPARALAAMLNHSKPPEPGDLLPPSWHWLYFLDTPSTDGTGMDGHPHKGDFLPSIPLSRRMWASGSLEVVQPLCLGEPSEKLSTIRSLEYKRGSTGELVFVSIEHRLQQRSVLCIREEQTIVYRAIPAERMPLSSGEQAPTTAEWSCTIAPDPVLLFRFSALTYNAYRIHYDRDYATRQELYPGLVLHAPLLVTLLINLALQQELALPIRTLRFRAVRPTFDLGSVQLRGKRDGDRLSLWSADHENFVGIRATAELGRTA